MTTWAILSGIEGYLEAYEVVLADIKRQRKQIEELYILGDVIAAIPESTNVIQLLNLERYDMVQKKALNRLNAIKSLLVLKYSGRNFLSVNAISIRDN